MSECQTLLLFILQIKAISRLAQAIYLLRALSRYYYTRVSNPIAGLATPMACGVGVSSRSESLALVSFMRQNVLVCE